MSEDTPELDNFKEVKKELESGNPPTIQAGIGKAIQNLVIGVVNTRLQIRTLQKTIGDAVERMDSLNKNVEIFNKESSAWAKRAFWTSFFIALGTIATAIAATLTILNR